MESKDKKFETVWLLTQISNQLLTKKEDDVAIASPGSSTGVLNEG